MLTKPVLVPYWLAASIAVASAGCNTPPKTATAPAYDGLSTPELERLAAGGTDARALRELAYRDAQSGNNQTALQHLDAALKLEPGSSDAHNIRGMVLVSLGRGSDAIQEFQAAAELGPTRVGPRLNLGRYYLSLDQPAAAARALEEAVKINPSHAEAARLAGDAWRLVGSSVAAKRSYRAALELKPDDASAHAGLGEVLVNSGRFEEALVELERARELGDTLARTRGYLGLAHAMAATTPDQAKVALEHLEAVRSAGERGSHVYYGFGLAYLAAKEFKLAEDRLREGLHSYPDVAGLHYTLGEVYAATGRTAESRSLRERSAALTAVREEEQRFLDRISSQPQDMARYLAYADWLIGRKEADRALPMLRQAQSMAPQNASIRQRLARAEKLAKPSPSRARSAGRTTR